MLGLNTVMNHDDELVGIAEVYKQPKNHTELKRMVEQYLDLTRENANLCRRDRDYYDGDQLSSNVKAELSKRGQPEIVNNKIAPAINGLFGLIDAAATSPEAWPRNVSSQNAADVCTKTLRFLTDRGDYPKVRKQASENFLIQGTCAAALEFNGKHIDIARIRWEDLIFDPLAREHDFSDSKYMGIAKMIDAADVEAMYPEAYKALGTPVGDFNDFFDTKAKTRWWSTAKRDRLRVVDLYYEVCGEWHRAIFCDTGDLFAGPSDYHDDYGNSMCPIVAASFESKQNGDRYGVVRHMISLQDETNARRSKLLHHLNHRQTQQTDMYAPVANKEIARREAARADGTIPFGWAVVPSQDMAQGQMTILQQTMSDLDRMAPSAAVLGRSGGASESGRARQVLQQAGNSELARGFSRFQEFETTIYRKLWMIAKEYIDQPTWIRILDDPKAPEFLQLNEPIMGPVAKPALDPSTGQPLIDPMTGQPRVVMAMGVTGMKNRIAELDMDIILSTTPDAVSLQHEIFQQILEYASSTGISPFDPKFIALIEMSTMPDKAGTIERLKRLAGKQDQNGEAQAAQMQAAMAQQQGDLQLKAAKTEKDKAHAMKATADAERVTLENHAFVAAAAQHVSQNYPRS